jgi:hypothetical protein
MKPIYPIRFFVLLFSIALLVVSGCQKDPKEDIKKTPPPTPTPVSRPDTRPLPPSIDTTPDWSVTGKIPQTLVCGQQYEVEVRAKENWTSCIGYNYQKLYDRAVVIATKRISNISCPQACRPVRSWQIERKWDCVSNILPTVPLPMQIAMAVVRYGVLCPNASQPIPTDAPFSILPPPYNAPYNPPAVPTSSGDIIDGNYSLWRPPVTCPSSDPIYIKYFETPKSCAFGINYAPFLTRAEEWAKLNYELESCKTPCTKHPFRVRHRRWNCTGPPRRVDVDITYILDCH